MTWTLSWIPRAPFSATELRSFVTHKGSLYAGTGQWLNDGPPEGPQIIRLDSDSGEWKLEQTFTINPVNRIAVACMDQLTFPTAKLTTLVCGFFGGSAVGVKDGINAWSTTPIGNRLGQIRSFIAHKDSITTVDMAFAGADQGIFSGVYDAVVPGTIQWTSYPELDISNFPPMSNGHPERVMSFVEVRGTLYATIGQKIYRRNDGGRSSWTEVWKNPNPGISQSGLRGATLINGNIWIGVEGTAGRIIEIDPTTWEVITSLDLSGTHKYYIIVAYNDFCVTKAPDGSEMILAGMDGRETGPAHYIVYNKGIWKRCAIPQLTPKPMVSCRSIIQSPFNNNDIYFGGYDANGKPARNTAWAVKADKTSVLSDM